MVVEAFIKSKLSIRDSNSGFTLIELLVTSVVASIMLGLILGLIVEQRRLFLGDQTRSQVDQNLRAAMDFIGTDIKQAGERLESDTELPGISIIDHSGDTPPAPAELVLQRKLISDVLPVCQTITEGTTQATIDVSVSGTPAIANCPLSNGNTSDSPDVPDTLEQWRNYRWSQNDAPDTNPPVGTRTVALNPPTTKCLQAGGADGECGWAYIDDPVNNRGEFFLYAFENSGTCAFSALATRTCYRLHAYANPNDSDATKRGKWQYTYTYGGTTAAAANQPRLYILEERRYQLALDTSTLRTDDYILQLFTNRQSPPLRLVNQLGWPRTGCTPSSINSCSQFQAQTSSGWANSFNNTLVAPNSTYTSSVLSNPTYTTDWNQIQAIKVDLTAINPNPSVQVSNLTLSSQFFPRNALSK
jgi:type IV pilus assembly protein PilW